MVKKEGTGYSNHGEEQTDLISYLKNSIITLLLQTYYRHMKFRPVPAVCILRAFSDKIF